MTARLTTRWRPSGPSGSPRDREDIANRRGRGGGGPVHMRHGSSPLNRERLTGIDSLFRRPEANHPGRCGGSTRTCAIFSLSPNSTARYPHVMRLIDVQHNK